MQNHVTVMYHLEVYPPQDSQYERRKPKIKSIFNSLLFLLDIDLSNQAERLFIHAGPEGDHPLGVRCCLLVG